MRTKLRELFDEWWLAKIFEQGSYRASSAFEKVVTQKFATFYENIVSKAYKPSRYFNFRQLLILHQWNQSWREYQQGKTEMNDYHQLHLMEITYKEELSKEILAKTDHFGPNHWIKCR